VRVLVISPHPDDESIGCGGALRKHVEAGDAVRAVFLTSGEKGGHGRSEQETARVREREAQAAADVLGIGEREFFRLPDGAVRATRAAVLRLRESLVNWKPEVIYLPHAAEMHVDHRAAARLLKQALSGLSRYHPRVLMYEIWTPLQEIGEIVDITPFVPVKRAAIRAHRSQCAVMDFAAAALGLNRYRGELHCWPGGEYAEAFCELHLENGSSKR
jgi:LmbE family N-acetylglucosaminyl deacetylase